VPVEEVGVGCRGSVVVGGGMGGEFGCLADYGMGVLERGVDGGGRGELRIRFMVGDFELNLGEAMVF
jgi:hypothetical protein